MKRMVIVLVVLLGAASLGYVYYAKNSTKNGHGEAEAQLVSAERGDIRLEVSSTGIVESNLDVEIKCKASGEIVSLPFDISDQVKEGDLLLELDPVDEERNVRQAEVQLASSRARLAIAQKNLKTSELEIENARREAHAQLKSAQITAKDRQEKAKRMKELVAKKFASPEDCETAETDAASAMASLEIAQIRLKELEVQEQALETQRQDIILAQCTVESDELQLEDAKQRLEYTKVYAPMSGVVSERYVQKGQIISSPTSNVGGGSELLMLSDLSRMFVVASVDESLIGQIAVDQSAEISVDAYPDLSMKGQVVRIATKGASESSVVTFEVKIEVLDENKDKLRPEMTANVDIIVADKKNVVLLPSESIISRDGKQAVLVASGPGQPPQHTPVTAGVDDGVSVEITEGVNEGDTILIPDASSEGRWTRNKDDEDDRGPRGMMMLGGPPPGGGGPPPRR